MLTVLQQAGKCLTLHVLKQKQRLLTVIQFSVLCTLLVSGWTKMCQYKSQSWFHGCETWSVRL